MIIWKGYGFMVLLIAIIIGAIVSYIFSIAGSTEDMGAGVGAIISGIVIWFVGNHFNSSKNDRTVIDKKTGKEFILKQEHSMFFIKMQYWAFIVGGIGVFMIIDILVHGKSSF
jgi:hypothetical protein